MKLKTNSFLKKTVVLYFILVVALCLVSAYISFESKHKFTPLYGKQGEQATTAVRKTTAQDLIKRFKPQSPQTQKSDNVSAFSGWGASEFGPASEPQEETLTE